MSGWHKGFGFGDVMGFCGIGLIFAAMWLWKGGRNMKKYRVSPTLKDDVGFVLTRDGVEHSFVQKESGEWMVETGLSAKAFQTAVIDAICEACRRETGSDFPYYSLETLRDRQKFLRLQRLFWKEEDVDRVAEKPFRLLWTRKN